MKYPIIRTASIFLAVPFLAGWLCAAEGPSRQLESQAGRWTFLPSEEIVLTALASDERPAQLEVRSVPIDQAYLRQTKLIGQRRKLSPTEEAYLKEAEQRLSRNSSGTVIVESDDKSVAAPALNGAVVWKIALDEHGVGKIAGGTLPPGIYEVSATSGGNAVARILTIREPLDVKNFLMRGTDLFRADANHRELFLMPEAHINTLQAYYREPVGADSLAALGFSGVDVSVLPKPDPAWAPARPDGSDGKRQFYNVSFNNEDSKKAASDYIGNGPGALRVKHPFAALTLTINEVADQPSLDYSESANNAWHHYLQETYGTIGKLNEDWGSDSASFADIPMPQPPEGVGGSLNVTLMDADLQEKQAAAAKQPAWIRAAWWHWVKFKDLSMRSWLDNALGAFRKGGAQNIANKYIHPHHDPGMAFRCNWFDLAKESPADLLTYDSYNPTWKFGAYFADLASQFSSTPWVLETNKLGGPAEEAASELFSLYAHGLTGVAYFKWQPYREGNYHFGMLDDQWLPGAKFRAVAATFALAERTAPSLLHTRAERAPVALVYPHSDLVQNNLRDWDLLRNWHALYGAFTGRHIVPTILSEEFGGESVPKELKVVVLADVTHVGPQVWANLHSWVEQGGTLLLAGKTGLFDRYGRPSDALQENFGFRIGDKRLPRQHIGADSLAANVFGIGEWFIFENDYWRTAPALLEYLPEGKGWEVNTTTNMKNVAMMTRSLGKGKVIALPWSPGSMFRMASAGPLLERLWFKLLEMEGVSAPFTVEGPAGAELDAVLRRSGDQRGYFLAGANQGLPGRFSFSLPATEPMRAFDMAAEKEIALRKGQDGRISFDKEFRTFEPFAVTLVPASSKAEIKRSGSRLSITGPGIPWTLRVTDAEGLTIVQNQSGLGGQTVELPGFRAAVPPYTAELETPLGKQKLTWKK